VGTALLEGYYDTPQGCLLSDLAAKLGLIDPTAGKALHRAEEQVMKHFADQFGGAAGG